MGTKPSNKDIRPVAEFVRNRNGIRVKKCCLSCAHKCLTRAQTTRRCEISGENVSRYHVCPLWEMSRMLERVGDARAPVKSKAYLMFYLGIRQEEQRAEEKGLPVEPKSTEAIREDYEREHGNIYINM